MFIIKKVERLNGRPKYIRSNKDVIVLSKPSSWASSLEKLETKKKKKKGDLISRDSKSFRCFGDGI